jgi:hypothetical protein
VPANHLANISHLIICPDGQLSRLPFELLSHDSRFLIEDKTISYVGSGREILRLAHPVANVEPNAAMVFGNPDFNLDLTKVSGLSFRFAGSAGLVVASSTPATSDGSQCC